jgi:hypothetical protein
MEGDFAVEDFEFEVDLGLVLLCQILVDCNGVTFLVVVGLQCELSGALLEILIEQNVDSVDDGEDLLNQEEIDFF